MSTWQHHIRITDLCDAAALYALDRECVELDVWAKALAIASEENDRLSFERYLGRIRGYVTGKLECASDDQSLWALSVKLLEIEINT